MNKLLLLGASAALVLPLAVSAAGHRKPGLWQTTIQMNFTKGGPQIPPDQLAKMQQLGIKMPMMGGQPQTFQQCLTAEQAAKEDHPEIGSKDCQMQNASWSGNTFSADMVCTGPRTGEMHGHFSGTFSGDSFSGTSHMEGNNQHMGGDFAMDQQYSGKWLGADCGTVQPGGVKMQ